MKEQSLLRLQNETKSYGLSLFERLARMENLLSICAIKLSLTDNHQRPALDNELKENVSSLFDSVYLVVPNGEYAPIAGFLATQKLKDIAVQYSPGNPKSQILIGQFSEFVSPVYMLVALDKKQPQDGFLLAEINTSFLWGIGSVMLLPAMTELAVYDDSNRPVILTYAAPAERHRLVSRPLHASDKRLFEYEREGSLYLASSWTLFLQSEFDAPLWTIILSQSKKDILAPMTEFRQVFPLVSLLFLWAVLFLSMYTLRKTLAPLNKLKEGTQRIANKDFTTQVDVDSGDEFEELAVSFNSMSARLNNQFNALAVIDQINRAILSSLDPSIVVATALRMMSDFFNSEVILYARINTENPETLALSILEKGGRATPDSENTDITLGERENIFANDEYTLLDSVEQIPRFLSSFVATSNIFLSLPLFIEQKLVGAVIMGLNMVDQANVEEEIKQARQIADLLAIALANASLVQELELLNIGTVEALSRTVDAKSEWTAGHSERVAELSVKVASVMGFDSKNIALLYRGGLLHDIGKIGIPLTILDKPEKLDDDEFDTVRSHPLIGEKILQPIDVYKNILPIVIQHHERFDGKGYPYGLSGSDIDINARILAVADVYDALISQRPYRQGWAREDVLIYIEEQAGKMFDPDVVDAFMAIAY
ncbi:MAG: HD domain-containing protein [Proteobacteria bacterium]|nr:HD domain-containing protein [Pseudomonadota bacterium]MBU1416890.1 HD domain-containing protein [Pseudomonadota bacterium]MBU1454720.1 HD domain-containing protein [Pseudomonadota bacterium]